MAGFKLLLVYLLLISSPCKSIACSMCKITVDGKTMVGNNEDAWRIDSKIWFEQGRDGNYGAAYVGHQDMFPQGSLNEKGLVFDGFAVYPRKLRPQPGKEKITGTAEFIYQIMRTCATVQEVHDLAIRYDRSIFNRSMLLFVDPSGRYLIMEVDTLIFGDRASYTLANFCPSIVQPQTVTLPRYLRGLSFLAGHSLDSSESFCRAVMDTMHECRNPLGDGTTYTSIYDLSEGLIYLYFYHDFNRVVKFNLRDELSRGDHVLRMTTLFAANKEYLRFTEFLTPFNSAYLWSLLWGLTAGFLVSAIWLLVYSAARMKNDKADSKRLFSWLVFSMLVLDGLLAEYLYLLSTDQGIYFLPRPYIFDQRPWLNPISYLPLVLMLVLVPLIVYNIRSDRQRRFDRFTQFILSSNLLGYLLVLLLFGYWGLFNIFTR